MFKGLADRLAEAFAECLHQRVRRGFVGLCAPDEALGNEALIKEKYQGIAPRPATRPAPSTRAKVDLFEALRTDEIGMHLTREASAMYPASSVSGFYLAHPQATYFSRGHRLVTISCRIHGRSAGAWTWKNCAAAWPPTWGDGQKSLWF